MSPARPGRDAAQRSPEEGKRVALSQRQLEVLQEMATGKSNKEIARSLDIAVDTVRAHVVEILSRLGVRNRTEAVTVYYSGQYEVSK
jgi:Response regulator containing a CheY-like receiver domain and an HTH DNA-binding domain